MDTTKNSNEKHCNCSPNGEQAGSCTVEAIVTIDERGQIVIPKSLREKLGISGCEKLVLISWEKNSVVESLSIMRNDMFSEMIHQYYSNK